MLTILGQSDRKANHCDGLSRRGFLRVGGMAAGGLSLVQLLALQAQAGIRSSDLLIAPYPEAAAVYFMHMPAKKLFGPVIQHVVSFRKDAKYMVVNIGGRLNSV